MPGKRITDHQVHKYKEHRNKLTQVAAAAKAGISERSARRVEASNVLPSQRPERHWRTREDPLNAVWESEIVALLQGPMVLMAVTESQPRFDKGSLLQAKPVANRDKGDWLATSADGKQITMRPFMNIDKESYSAYVLLES